MAHAQLQDVIRHLRTALAARDAAGVPDARLLERFLRQRDEAAFELLVWRHGRMVLCTCRRLLRDVHEAEDAFQACFLALARRAGSIGRRESVGGWLHKVAYRLALGARARRSRRDARERPLDDAAPAAGPADPAAEAARREVRRALDEELSRLPDRYRVPFVLCHLEGRSNADAAREVGCPVGTVESRLTRARKLLRTRLSRKGLALSAGPAVSVPAALAASTARAATLVVTGQATAAGLISTRVIAMTEGVLRAMFMSKLKTAAAILLAVALTGAGIGVVARGTPAEQPGAVRDRSPAAGGAARIARLIEQLGSETFDEREQASKGLDEIGAPALGALRKAAHGDDPERKKRAGELVEKIERRREAARLLAAKRVRLAYKDTPLAEAVADFRKQSGYDLTLHDPEDKLKDRKVTLDTGDVTFWQALDQFCRKAGLTEVTRPAAAPPGPRGPAAGGAGLPGRAGKGGGGGGGLPGAPGGAGGSMRGPAGRPLSTARRIVLTDGQPPTLPTDDRSAVRVRALDRANAPAAPAEAELLLALEIAPEPALRWQQTVAVRVSRATDDRGHDLGQIAADNPAPGRPGGGALGAAVGGFAGRFPGAGGAGAGVMLGGPDQDAGVTVASVRLRPGVRAATSLREFAGSITARVRGEGRPLITVTDVLKSAGKTFRGADSGSLKVQDVTKEANGAVKVRLELDPPADLDLAGALLRMSSSAGRVVLSKRDLNEPDGVQHELAFTDDGGGVLPLAGVEFRTGAGKGIEITLSCHHQKGQGDPAKLVLSVSKGVILDVPFALKNVPLPRGRADK